MSQADNSPPLANTFGKTHIRTRHGGGAAQAEERTNLIMALAHPHASVLGDRRQTLRLAPMQRLWPSPLFPLDASKFQGK